MNALLESIGITLPIFQAPMAGISTPAMAAAVSEYGGLGAIAIGSLDSDTAREVISSVHELTKRPFNVNVFCHATPKKDPRREARWIDFLSPYFREFGCAPPHELQSIYESFLDNHHQLEILLEQRPKVVSFHFGIPGSTKIERLQRNGSFLIASATNLTEAKEIEAAGIDAVVAQGFEAGGHRSVFDPVASDSQLSTGELVETLVTNLRIPVIAAGGIMDGPGIADMLRLGASAAQLGTAFVSCSESSADEGYRAALRASHSTETVMTRAISGRVARCLVNRFTKLGASVAPGDVPDYPIAYDAGKALNAAAKAKGDFGFGAHWAGTGFRACRGASTATLLAELAEELRFAAGWGGSKPSSTQEP